jgi:hypothetical protein
MSLKNSANESIVGSLKYKVICPVAAWARSTQRGFLNGRNFLKRIIEIDARGRMMGLAKAARLPALIFLISL